MRGFAANWFVFVAEAHRFRSLSFTFSSRRLLEILQGTDSK
jgi:hypothetical protein